MVLPQIRLEPILQRWAQALNPQGLRYNAEVVDVREDSEAGVTVSGRHSATESRTEECHARYVIGADGGRFMGEKIGVSWEGPRSLVNMVSCHFRAPLSKIHEPEALITYLAGQPETGWYHRHWGFKSSGAVSRSGRDGGVDVRFRHPAGSSGPVRQGEGSHTTEVAQGSPNNFSSHGLAMDKALGIDIANYAATNVDAKNNYFSPVHPEYARLRKAAADAQAVLDSELHVLGTKVGWFYPSADLEGEGSGNSHDGALLDNGEFDGY